MNIRTVAMAVALTVVPTVASAQYEDWALRALSAAQQIERQVWIDNPNKAEMGRHILIVMRDNGFDPGYNPWELSTAWDPSGIESSQCVWHWDDEIGWYTRCDEWTAGTMACATAQDIFDLRRNASGVRWVGHIFTAASIYAGSVAQPWFAGYFAVVSLTMQVAAEGMESHIISLEGQRCREP